MLAYPDPNEPYIVDMDASNLAIGAVLSQVQNGEESCMLLNRNNVGVRQDKNILL